MKEKFIQFLKDNGALEIFEANCKGDENSCTINEAFEDCHIGKAFVWEQTPEGHEFWEKLSAKQCEL